MNLIPYRKRSGVNSLSPFSLLEDMFETSIAHGLPHTDIHDTGERFIIETDLPGLEKKDIEVTVHGNTLFIRGEKKRDEKTQDIGYLRSERFFGQFERALPLTDDIDPNKVDASYKNGVLTISIAKKEEAKPKQISVNIK